LQAGDALYLPAYWWHQVHSLGTENVNLNCWWLPSGRKQLRHCNQAVRGYYQLLSRFVKQGGLLKAPRQEAA
jgi:ribosomal protein L16 Arg81 hydroxylase